MNRAKCEEVQRMLALDGRALQGEAAAHLRECLECREEALRLDQLFGLLADSAEVPVPESVDSFVTTLLAEPPREANGILRPRLALALSVLGLATGFLGYATWLSAAEQEAASNLIGFGIVWLFLLFGASAMLPLIVHYRMRGFPRTEEAES